MMSNDEIEKKNIQLQKKLKIKFWKKRTGNFGLKGWINKKNQFYKRIERKNIQKVRKNF
jgi:hypothetical protein